MGVSNLEGTPWHLETLKSNRPGTRRDKRGCKFFRENNSCTKFGKCMSGRYCRVYKKDDGKEYKLNDEQIKELASIMSKRGHKTIIKNKPKEKTQANKQKQSQIRSIKYKTKENIDYSKNEQIINSKKKNEISVQIGDTVSHEKYGIGRIVEFGKSGKTIIVKFQNEQKKFVFPDAFMQKHLLLN